MFSFRFFFPIILFFVTFDNFFSSNRKITAEFELMIAKMMGKLI